MNDALAADSIETARVAPCADEQEWVRRSRDGDLQAFDLIMQRYEGRLFRFLLGLTGDRELAAELCQDTFLAAYQALPRGTREMRLGSWLHTIALNRARSHFRRKANTMTSPLEEKHYPMLSTDVQEAVVRSDIVTRVLERLPPRYAQPLLLQVIGGLSCREIATILHCTEGAAKVRLLRAREAFRRIYLEEDQGS